MTLLQFRQKPLEIDVVEPLEGGKKRVRRLIIPKFTLGDMISWSEQIMEGRIEYITREMSPQTKSQWLTMYPPIPPDIDEMKRLVRTFKGAKDVVTACLKEAEVREAGKDTASLTEDEIERFIEAGAGRITEMAWVLADLNEANGIARPAQEDNDPLAPTGNGDSTHSATIGATTSQPSTPPTPEKIPSPALSRSLKSSSSEPNQPSPT